MQHLVYTILLILIRKCLAVNAQQYQPTVHLRPQYPNGITPDFRVTNTQAQSARSLQSYPERVLLFHNTELQNPTTAVQRSGPSAPTQLWSGQPIVVDYDVDDGRTSIDRESQFLEQQQYTPGTIRRFPSPPHDTSYDPELYAGRTGIPLVQQNLNKQLSHHNSANLNFNEGQPQFGSYKNHQRIPVSNYERQPQPQQLNARPNWRSSGLYASQYAAHFENYIRKYPYRLQPVFETHDRGK